MTGFSRFAVIASLAATYVAGAATQALASPHSVDAPLPPFASSTSVQDANVGMGIPPNPSVTDRDNTTIPGGVRYDMPRHHRHYYHHRDYDTW